jgi:hypothetical protein
MDLDEHGGIHDLPDIREVVDEREMNPDLPAELLAERVAVLDNLLPVSDSLFFGEFTRTKRCPLCIRPRRN